MSLLDKLRHKLDKPPKGFEEGEWKWTKRIMGTMAIAAVVAGAGITGERLLSDDYVELNPDQKKELAIENQATLEMLSGLPFDALGHFEGRLDNKAISGAYDSLEVELRVEPDKLVVEGEGQHTGLTSVKNRIEKQPIEKPTDFRLVYELDGMTVATIPIEVLKEVMTSGRMPSEGSYKRIETVVLDGVKNTPHEFEEGIAVKASPQGEIEGIQRGKDPVFGGSEGAVDNAKAFYGSVRDDIGRFVT